MPKSKYDVHQTAKRSPSMAEAFVEALQEWNRSRLNMPFERWCAETGRLGVGSGQFLELVAASKSTQRLFADHSRVVRTRSGYIAESARSAVPLKVEYIARVCGFYVAPWPRDALIPQYVYGGQETLEVGGFRTPEEAWRAAAEVALAWPDVREAFEAGRWPDFAAIAKACGYAVSRTPGGEKFWFFADPNANPLRPSRNEYHTESEAWIAAGQHAVQNVRPPKALQEEPRAEESAPAIRP